MGAVMTNPSNHSQSCQRDASPKMLVENIFQKQFFEEMELYNVGGHDKCLLITLATQADAIIAVINVANVRYV